MIEDKKKAEQTPPDENSGLNLSLDRIGTVRFRRLQERKD